MKIHYITVEEYLKTKVHKKLIPPKDVAKLIEVTKNTELNHDPKSMAEALVMINSIGIKKIHDYLG